MAEPPGYTLTWAQGGAGHAVTLLIDGHLLAGHEEDRRIDVVAHLSDLTSAVLARDLGHGGSLYVRHERRAVEVALEWPREDQDEYGREMAVTLFVYSRPGWVPEAVANAIVSQAELLEAYGFDLRPGLPERRESLVELINLSSRPGCSGWRSHVRAARARLGGVSDVV